MGHVAILNRLAFKSMVGGLHVARSPNWPPLRSWASVSSWGPWLLLLALERFMLAAEVVERHKDCLHGCVVLGALAVSIRQTGVTAIVHPYREIHALDMRSAYPVIFGLTEDR